MDMARSRGRFFLVSCRAPVRGAFLCVAQAPINASAFTHAIFVELNEASLRGGTVSAATIDGGTLMLGSGAAVSGVLVFSSGGTLEIIGTAMPSVTISGFTAGDIIDLAQDVHTGAGVAGGYGESPTAADGGRNRGDLSALLPSVVRTNWVPE
jgi:hypothetical protein